MGREKIVTMLIGGGRWVTLFIVLSVFCLSGCAASRSELSGAFTGSAERNIGADKVSVLFLFHHLKQQHGFDSIPKIQSHGVKDFDNIFGDALNELSNISTYATYTENPNDVNNPARRQEREKLRSSHDYTLDIRIFEETAFKQQFLSGTISLLSLTIVPMPYSWDYTFTADIYDRKGNFVKSYQRTATLDNWVELFLLFAYPFHPIEGKREQIYAESLHDIFRQIETERVLKD